MQSEGSMVDSSMKRKSMSPVEKGSAPPSFKKKPNKPKPIQQQKTMNDESENDEKSDEDVRN
jgi:hypothetical protein